MSQPNIDEKIYDALNGKITEIQPDEPQIESVFDYIIDMGQKDREKATAIGKLLHQNGYADVLIESGNDLVADLNKIPESVLRDIYSVLRKNAK